jgi:hypothetical protein
LNAIVIRAPPGQVLPVFAPMMTRSAFCIAHLFENSFIGQAEGHAKLHFAARHVDTRAKTTGNGGRPWDRHQSYGKQDQRRNQKSKRIGWAYSGQHGAEESKANVGAKAKCPVFTVRAKFPE